MPLTLAVPVPPTDLSAPTASSVVFTVMCSIIFVGAVVLALVAARRGDRLGIMLILGGLLTGMLEPLLDYLGLLWFARDNVAIAVTTFYRFIPLYVVLGYAFFFGGQTFIAYRALVSGRSTSWFWKLWAFSWIFDFALQATGSVAGLYRYYGDQPFMILGAPAWWFTIDATLPAMCAAVLFAMRGLLTGPRILVVLPVVPAVYGGLNVAAGWPVFSALNSAVPPVVVWLGGFATIGLAVLYNSLVISGIRRMQLAAGIVHTARTPLFASALR